MLGILLMTQADKTMNPVQFGEYTGKMSSQITQPMKSMSMILLMVCLLSEHVSSSWVPTTEFLNRAKIMPDMMLSIISYNIVNLSGI